jgi:cell division protein ZapE
MTQHQPQQISDPKPVLPGSLQQIYAARIASGDLREDPAQLALMPLLQQVRDGLEATPVRPGGLRGLFSRQKAEPVRGLYIWGGVGRGKSMLMDLFYDAVEVPKRRVHFHAFMQEIHAAVHKARQDEIADALQPVAAEIASGLRLLCFDEMVITDITDAMMVGRLFDLLFAAGVTVVTTSNRLPDDLYLNGLNRNLFLPFIALLNQRLEVFHLQSPHDYRQNLLTGGEVYFSPATPECRARMNRLWSDLSGGEAAPRVIKVNSRDVTLAQYRNGVARSSFWDLCSRMLGPADYLAIADAVEVLFLDDIPLLGRSNFNEAKRFVTLIDALYEARVRLVATAAAQPEMLYVEGEGIFEFERTASRLREMQGADWGAERGAERGAASTGKDGNSGGA